MHPKKQLALAINVLGGIAVLGSYAWGFRTHANASEILWGGVPAAIRPFYTAGMLLAAVGYFAFSYFILFRLPPDETKIGARYGFDVFTALYAIILFASAHWMPLTFAAIEAHSVALAWFVRLILAIVAAGSLALLAALLRVKPRRPMWAHRLAIIGTAAFCLQTAVLDAVVWSAFFHV